MSQLTPDTLNFGARVLFALFGILGACIAPVTALILLNRVAVRLAAPGIERELLASQSFMDRVAAIAEHKGRNVETKLQHTLEAIQGQLAVLDKLTVDMQDVKRDMAVLKYRAEREVHA